MTELELPIRGSCLCGAVAFELLAKPLYMTTCHCSRCRKAGGATTVGVLAKHFRWVRGQELAERYVPEPPYRNKRVFCRRCGSYLGEPDLDEEGFPVAASALDDDAGLRRALHEHVAEKPDWYDIRDEAPQFAGHPPGFGPKE